MDLAEHIYRVLFVSAPGKFCDSMLPLLSESKFNPVTTVGDVSAARRLLLENQYDLVIINTPLPDEFGTRLALDVCEDSGIGVLLFVKSEHYPEINAKVSPHGVLTISKPTSSAVVSQSLLLLCATRERLRRFEQKTISVEEKMEEIRLVNRAKWLLIEQLKMTEPDAHRYIEKVAMDNCITKRAVAESIIKNYH